MSYNSCIVVFPQVDSPSLSLHSHCVATKSFFVSTRLIPFGIDFEITTLNCPWNFTTFTLTHPASSFMFNNWSLTHQRTHNRRNSRPSSRPFS